MPGRCLRSRWGSSFSITELIRKVIEYLPKIFKFVFSKDDDGLGNYERSRRLVVIAQNYEKYYGAQVNEILFSICFYRV